MTIQELKTNIENNTLSSQLLIFKNSDSNFLSTQYINKIAEVKNLPINYLENLDSLLKYSESLFDDITSEVTTLNVYIEDTFTGTDPQISNLTNLIIITRKFQDKELESLLHSYIIEFPKIEDWQWKDYGYSLTEGADEKDIDWLLDLCTDKNRLDLELSKLSIFTNQERKYLFKDLIRDGLLDDLSSYNIFNFSTALMTKNIENLTNIYKEFERVDIEPYGLLTILKKNFRNLLTVQLTANPTPENTGLEGKQLYAIKKQPKVFSPTQLLTIYEFLCDIDRQIKEGELPTTLLVDYLVIKVLTI